MTSIILFL